MPHLMPVWGRNQMAAPSPTEDHINVKRDVPKIGGSEGGFIVLIVCLILIIMVSCSAVFCLLRGGDSTPQSRVSRRRSHHQHQPLPSLKSPARRFSLSDKFTGILRLHKSPTHTAQHSPIINTTGKEVTVQGWTPAGGSSDGWESDSGEDKRDGELRQVPAPRGGAPKPLSIMSPDPSFHPPRHASTSSGSSVRFDDPPTPERSSSPENEFRGPAFTGSGVIRPSIHTQLSFSSLSTTSPTNILPIRTTSPEPLPNLPPQSASRPSPPSRQWSTQSGLSIRTFEGGTKFIESL